MKTNKTHEARITRLETKIPYLEDMIIEIKQRLEKLDDKMDDILLKLESNTLKLAIIVGLVVAVGSKLLSKLW